MDANSWSEGATLLREWFANPVGGGAPDTSTITMNWVLGFSRARAVYDSIFNDQIYVSPNAQPHIVTLLRRLGVDKGGSFNFSLPVTALDPTYFVNFKTVGAMTDPLDGLKAALGRSTFRVVVGGLVIKTTSTSKAIITDIGVLVSDSFDFDGFQPLGCWNICTNEVGNVTCGGGERVSNASFRDWRTTNARGGDFRVYSDVRSTHLPSAASFDFT